MTSLADLAYEAANPQEEETRSAKYARLAALSLEMRGIPDVEPSNLTTLFELPTGLELTEAYTDDDGARCKVTVHVYTAKWEGRELAFYCVDELLSRIEVDAGEPITDVQEDMLGQWFAGVKS
jgi:hypothetical protein